MKINKNLFSRFLESHRSYVSLLEVHIKNDEFHVNLTLMNFARKNYLFGTFFFVVRRVFFWTYNR